MLRKTLFVLAALLSPFAMTGCTVRVDEADTPDVDVEVKPKPAEVEVTPKP